MGAFARPCLGFLHNSKWTEQAHACSMACWLLCFKPGVWMLALTKNCAWIAFLSLSRFFIFTIPEPSHKKREADVQIEGDIATRTHFAFCSGRVPDPRGQQGRVLQARRSGAPKHLIPKLDTHPVTGFVGRCRLSALASAAEALTSLLYQSGWIRRATAVEQWG